MTPPGPHQVTGEATDRAANATTEVWEVNNGSGTLSLTHDADGNTLDSGMMNKPISTLCVSIAAIAASSLTLHADDGFPKVLTADNRVTLVSYTKTRNQETSLVPKEVAFIFKVRESHPHLEL